MKKLFYFCSIAFIIAACSFPVFAKPLKAGIAKVVITPEKPIWLSGYAARNKPSEGKIHDIYAKALAIAEEDGRACVLVTTDILGFSRELAESIAETAKTKYGLEREQLMLNSSHTHTGPVLSGSLA